jgi:DNA repair exonuclease SbcCD nuclease subunit
MTGRYTFATEVIRLGVKQKISENDMKEMKYRDKLNYYALLMKYCYIALDHIHKRFKISIIPYQGNITIFHNYETCEIKLNNYLDKRLKEKLSSIKTRIPLADTKLNPYLYE